MNPALQLKDIHLPAPPSWWPPAPGWWLLALIILVLLAWLGRLLFRRYKLARQRRRILALLQKLEKSAGDRARPEHLAQLSGLMKRLALSRYPRRNVASLTGSRWLRFLDQTGGDGRFSEGPGRLLAEGPYRSELPEDIDIHALTALVHDWLSENMGEQA